MSTTAGQEVMAARLTALLDRPFAGRFRVDRLAVGPAGITLLGVEIVDPGGRRLALVEELHARPRLSPALLRGQVRLRSVELAGARLLVDGQALASAFGPRRPSPP